jgi:hypothetical protein
MSCKFLPLLSSTNGVCAIVLQNASKVASMHSDGYGSKCGLTEDNFQVHKRSLLIYLNHSHPLVFGPSTRQHVEEEGANRH